MAELRVHDDAIGLPGTVWLLELEPVRLDEFMSGIDAVFAIGSSHAAPDMVA